MNDEKKSVLDGIPVDDRAFPLNKSIRSGEAELLYVVGHCPVCGAPVYGPRAVRAGQEPQVKRSCLCTDCSRTIHDLTIVK